MSKQAQLFMAEKKTLRTTVAFSGTHFPKNAGNGENLLFVIYFLIVCIHLTLQYSPKRLSERQSVCPVVCFL